MQMTIKQARLYKGLTQVELAKALNIHVQTYRKIEQNPELATIEQAKKIAELTGISYNEIFFDSESSLSREGA